MTAAGFLIPAVLTAVIETVFFWAMSRRDRGFLFLCAAVNLMTNLALNLILSVTGREISLVLILEAAVVASEYLCYSAAEGRSRELFLLTAAANLISYLTGVMIYGWR